jgi:arginase
MRRVSVLGVPSSAASYAAGQELAPAALRDAGLLEALAAVGLDVHDDGDLTCQVWRPDPEHRYAQNIEQTRESLIDLTDRLNPLLTRGDFPLVIGGNCTIALGVLAALHRTEKRPPVLLYVDRDYDMNTPETTRDGVLDWMGMAHALDLEGCVGSIVDALNPRPLLNPERVAWLGVETERATAWEQSEAERLDLHVVTSGALAAEPVQSARAALGYLPIGPLAVHMDVDVLDFIDAPLAENADGRNSGPTLDQACQALTQAGHDPRMRAFSFGEINPTRTAGDPEVLSRFARKIADVVKAMAAASGDDDF